MWLREFSPGEAIARLNQVNIRAVTQALSRWDAAATAVLLAWSLALSYVQKSNQCITATDPIIHYFPAAQGVLDGEGYEAFRADVFRGPGYPLMLAGVTGLLHGDMFTAGKVIDVASSVLFLLFAYLLVRRVFDPTTALASILMIVGINTFAWISTGSGGTDIPFGWLAMASLYCMVRRETPDLLHAVLSGLFAGLALTVRWTGLFLLPSILIWAALIPRHRLDLRSRARAVVAYLLGFLISSGPWLYVNYRLHGNPLYNESAEFLDQYLFPLESGSAMDALVRALKSGPLQFGQRFVTRLIGGFPSIIQGLNNYPWHGGWVMAGLFWILVLVGVLFLLVRVDHLKLWLLLISCVWWASTTLVHYEARYYLMLMPTFSALPIFIVTSGILPDVRLSIGVGKRARVTSGYVLRRLFGSRLPAWLTANPAGTSLVALVLISLLVSAGLSTIQRTRKDRQWHSQQNAFYHELAEFIRQLPAAGQLRPIGVREYSRARYWIPIEAGVPAAPFPPWQDYETILTEVSYVLYDQFEEEDFLFESEDPDLARLRDPLRAPTRLEAVYYDPGPRRAVLYKVLEENNLAKIVSARASSALPNSPAAQAFDDDTQTHWSSQLHDNGDAVESITLDLGELTSLNHIWLLPKLGGQGFPSGLRVEVSQDGQTWQNVFEEEELPEPIQLSPQVFSFSETTARLVRVTATRLRWDEDEGGYLVSLAEVRISLAVERPAGFPAFSLGATDIFMDPLSGELVAKIHNQGEGTGQATVDFHQGWSAEGAEYLASVESSPVDPGGVGFARLPSSAWDPPQIGDCQPIWATLNPYLGLDVDTYGVAVSMQPQRVFARVCSPERAIVDDFDYLESPLARGWAVLDYAGKGEVATTYDPQLDRRVMWVSSEAEEGYVVVREMELRDRPELRVSVKSTSDFIIYVRVRVIDDDEYYYVHYMAYDWGDDQDEFPKGRYVYYPLGSYLADGRWHTLERDVYEDFLAKTGKEVDCIEAVAIRAFEDLKLANLSLGVSE